MAEKESSGLAHWWAGIRGKASQSVANQQAAFARGKVAGVSVTDDAGNTLVEAGQQIDDDILARAHKAGKVAAVAASAMKAQTQDFKEQLKSQQAGTLAGQEALMLNSVEDYREARNYRGRMLTMDVTDIKGNVVVPAGKELDEEDIRRVRDAGLLAAFLSVAQDSVPIGPDYNRTTPAPSPYAPPTPRQGPVLLGDPDDEP